jgi:hypothetical protein
MILYNSNMFLSHTFSKTNSSVEFLIAFFNGNTQQVLHIIEIFKPPQMNTNFFISILKNIVTKIPTNYSTIIIEDFNINMLTNTIESSTLKHNT